MYLDDKGEVIENLSLVGVRAAGVPGTVMGLWEAHQKFGKLKWSELLTPPSAMRRTASRLPRSSTSTATTPRPVQDRHQLQ
jgi:gamma-glutamyltranspeptidase